jgi:formiminotetrahydrofolate cyclodeaminase
MKRLIDQPVSQLYRTAASVEPAPGGGSVTALCGLLGTALVLKALRISLKRRADAEALGPAERGLEAVAERLADDADADAATFTAFIAALRMPKGSDPEAQARSKSLLAAAIASTEAGLEALEHVAQALGRTHALAGVISEQMAPDLEAGVALLEVMRRNAAHNAEANLASVKDETIRAALAERLARLRGAS